MSYKSANMKTPAFVFNCHYNGLALIQALGRRGIPVFALDSKRTIGTRSRYSLYRHIPDPLCDEKGFIAALLKISNQSNGKPILLPTNDHWAEAVAKHKERLSEYCLPSVSDQATVSLVLDKERFGRWAIAKGFKVPRVWAVEEALDQAKSLDYPVAVKANARRRPGQDAKGLDAARAADKMRFKACSGPEELEAAIKLAESYGVPVFCQQVVHGRSEHMHTIGVYARDGIVHGIVYGRKVRGYPPAFGDCIVGQAEPVPRWAKKLAMDLCRALEYTGIAEIEVMKDALTQEYFLIEINPRSWSWVGVGPAAGVDLAWLAYADLVLDQQPDSCLTSCPDGKPVIYSKVLADFQNAILWYRLSDAPDWAMGPFRWWNNYTGKKRVFAEFARDDPWVGFVSILQSGKQFAAKARNALRSRNTR